jgi:hypothetical protein
VVVVLAAVILIVVVVVVVVIAVAAAIVGLPLQNCVFNIPFKTTVAWKRGNRVV